jgi:hypothetical protein
MLSNNKDATPLKTFSEKPQLFFEQLSSPYPWSAMWEYAAEIFVSPIFKKDINEMKKYVQLVSLLRVGVPSIVVGYLAYLVYPDTSLMVASWIADPKAFEVVANDYAQYIQNILTTSGLMFSITVGYTYYFLYQQQENIYLALFEEVTQAKSLLEQVSLVSQGRPEFYKVILNCVNRYVEEDLSQFLVDPAVLVSKRPIDDPLEEIMYLTSVGEPSIVYQTVRSLRQARAYRLGALQRKLPPIHFILVWSLAAVILVTFPVLGAGSQTIGGLAILHVQAIYMSFIVFGIAMVMGVLNELREPLGKGAYNVVSVLNIMVAGLIQELEGRLNGQFVTNEKSPTKDGIAAMDSPSDDTILYYYDEHYGRDDDDC